MKLTLTMLTPAKVKGTLVPVGHSPFVIGREHDCHLRSKSSTVNPHHCALLVRQDKVFVNDFAGEAATFVNDHQIQGEQELHDRDCVRVGKLTFTVCVDNGAALTEPVEEAKPVKDSTDEVAANLLFAMEKQEEESNRMPGDATGDTLGCPEQTHRNDADKSTPKNRAVRADGPDTSAAARNLLARFRKPQGPGIGSRPTLPPGAK